MSSSNSPCAACKFLRRKCTQECVLAPYFPPDQPQRFVNIHKVFGNSNVTKILNELPVSQREEAVNSLAYEAESRLSDPVYGCVGLISYLQQMHHKLKNELDVAKRELASCTGGQVGFGPMWQNMYLHHSHNLPHNGGGGGGQFHHHSNNVSGPPSFSGGGDGVLPSNPNYMLQYNMAQMMGIPDKGRTSGITGFDIGDNQPQPLQTVNHNRSNGGMMMRESNLLLFNDNNPNNNNQNLNDDQDDNILTAQQLVAAMQDKEEHELMRNLEQQQQKQQTSPLKQEQLQAEQFLTFSGNGDGLPGGLMMGGGSNSDHSSGVTIGGGGGGRSFGHMVHNNNSSHVVDMPPSLALGTGFDTTSYHQEQHQQHDQTPLMLFQPMDSHHHSPDLELNRAAAIPQQFFQECPGTVGGGFGESRNNSSTATSC